MGRFGGWKPARLVRQESFSRSMAVTPGRSAGLLLTPVTALYPVRSPFGPQDAERFRDAKSRQTRLLRNSGPTADGFAAFPGAFIYLHSKLPVIDSYCPVRIPEWITTTFPHDECMVAWTGCREVTRVEAW